MWSCCVNKSRMVFFTLHMIPCYQYYNRFHRKGGRGPSKIVTINHHGGLGLFSVDDLRPIDPPHTSRNALDKYFTMHHFVTKMCTHVHISVTKRCSVGYLSGALWGLWYGCIDLATIYSVYITIWDRGYIYHGTLIQQIELNSRGNKFMIPSYMIESHTVMIQ